jgi:hypothetical protein
METTMREEEIRAIYDDIYSIYERHSDNHKRFVQLVNFRYNYSQILLVCERYSITHDCDHNAIKECYCCCEKYNRWYNSQYTAMHIKLMDIFIAFTPATEYILK